MEGTMASKTFSLGEILPNYYVFWTVTSQYGNTCTVVIKDSTSEFCNVTKNDTVSSLKLLDQSNRMRPNTGDVQVTITADNADSIYASCVPKDISDERGKQVGYNYAICFECLKNGQTGVFNDIYVNVVAWANKD
jgi:hypothetical protein